MSKMESELIFNSQSFISTPEQRNSLILRRSKSKSFKFIVTTVLKQLMTKPPVRVYDVPFSAGLDNVIPLGSSELALTASSKVYVRLAESISRAKFTSMGGVTSGVTLLTCSAAPLGIGIR